MQIHIRVLFTRYGTKAFRQANFTVNTYRFKQDPNQESARVAYDWIKQLKRESEISGLNKVVWNEENDITDLVKHLDNAPIPNLDLPF